MARGTMYQVVKKIGDLNTMSESDFYDKLDLLSCDFVKDEDEEESEIHIGWLREEFDHCGIAIFIIDDGYHFRTPGAEKLMDFKKLFFYDRFERFKRLFANFNAEDFCSVQAVSGLQQKIEDNYTDAVCYWDDCFQERIMTLDKFVRSLEPETDYYISQKTVLMH